MTIFLIGLFVGMFLGYAICDLLTKESSIVYHIKKLRARRGSTINVEAEAIATTDRKRVKRTKEERKQARIIKRNAKKAERAADKLEKKS